MVRIVTRYDHALIGALRAESDVAKRGVALVCTLLAVKGDDAGFRRVGAVARAVYVQALVGHCSGVFHLCSELRAVLEGGGDAGKVVELLYFLYQKKARRGGRWRGDVRPGRWRC